MKFRLFSHGPAAGAARAHGDFESVEVAEEFLNRPDNSPFDEGSSLYLVNSETNELWALTEEAIESGVEKFYNATSEDWAVGQIELMKGKGESTITFLGIEDRGLGPVATFEHVANFDDKSFCLNRTGLLSRIANVEAGLNHPSRNSSVERGALSMLEARMREVGRLTEDGVELCSHGTPKSERCEACVNEGLYTYARPRGAV